MSQPQQSRLSRQASSSLEINRKVQKRITEHAKQIIRQNNSTLSEQSSSKPQLIPEKIIEKNKLTHKYLYKKTLINTKFQWLNKYLQTSELQSLLVKMKSNKIELQNKQNQCLRPDENRTPSWKRNKRSKTEGPYFIGDLQKLSQVQGSERLPFFYEQQNIKEQQNTKDDNIFRERCMNKKILSQNYFRFKKSKSLRQKSNISGLDDQHLRKMLMDQRKINRSNCKYLQESNCNSKKQSDKENRSNHTFESKRQKGLFRIQIDENTPVKQFLECTARLNKSNLMMKNKSGYIKDRKRQYVLQSRQDKRQRSELLRIKKRCEQQISVQPWNLIGNEKEENEESQFFMNNHR